MPLIPTRDKLVHPKVRRQIVLPVPCRSRQKEAGHVLLRFGLKRLIQRCKAPAKQLGFALRKAPTIFRVFAVADRAGELAQVDQG